MRDAYKIAVNIENNKKESGKLGRRDDPKLFNLKTNNKRDANKTPTRKKIEEPTIGQVLDLLKKTNPTTFNTHKPNIGEKALVNNKTSINNIGCRTIPTQPNGRMVRQLLIRPKV